MIWFIVAAHLVASDMPVSEFSRVMRFLPATSSAVAGFPQSSWVLGVVPKRPRVSVVLALVPCHMRLVARTSYTHISFHRLPLEPRWYVLLFEGIMLSETLPRSVSPPPPPPDPNDVARSASVILFLDVCPPS